MKNNTNPPFAKHQPPVELSELIPGTRRPKTHLEKFGDFLSYIIGGEEIVDVKFYGNEIIDIVTESKEE